MPSPRAAPDLAAFVQEVFACSPEVALAIAGRAAERSFRAEAVILRQGDALGETFLVVLGRARAVAFGREGQLVFLQEFLPGDMFGALSQPGRDENPADVVAVDDVRAAVFLALDFLGLVERHSCVGLALSRMLLRQLRAATERMVERTTLTAVGRVYAELLRLGGDRRRISPWPVLAKLAFDVQTTRETASRAVNDLERRGVIRRDLPTGDLVIVAPHRLEELIA